MGVSVSIAWCCFLKMVLPPTQENLNNTRVMISSVGIWDLSLNRL